jgi:hypothetical protein
VCDISKEVARQLLAKAGRCETKDSHKINKNIITATTEIIDPTLATTFQYMYESG